MHAKRWVERGHHVNIVTSFPNFPDGKVFGGYRQSLFKRETLDTVAVTECPDPRPHALDRLTGRVRSIRE